MNCGKILNLELMQFFFCDLEKISRGGENLLPEGYRIRVKE